MSALSPLCFHESEVGCAFECPCLGAIAGRVAKGPMEGGANVQIALPIIDLQMLVCLLMKSQGIEASEQSTKRHHLTMRSRLMFLFGRKQKVSTKDIFEEETDVAKHIINVTHLSVQGYDMHMTCTRHVSDMRWTCGTHALRMCALHICKACLRHALDICMDGCKTRNIVQINSRCLCFPVSS